MQLVGLEICFSVLFWMLADIWDIGFTKKKNLWELLGVFFNPEPVPERDYQSQIPIETFFFPSKIQTYYLLYPSEFTYGSKELKDFSFGIQ